MPSRYDLSPLPPSSTFSQSTPALSQRPPYAHNASSSSPPNDLIATPSDRYDTARDTATARPNGKHQQRRSVRIRSSSGANFGSSPQTDFGGSDHVRAYGDKPSNDVMAESSGGGGRRRHDNAPPPSQFSYADEVFSSQVALPDASRLPPFPSSSHRPQAGARASSSLAFPLSIDTTSRHDASNAHHTHDAMTPSMTTFSHTAAHQAPLARTPNASSALQRATFDALAQGHGLKQHPSSEYEQSTSSSGARTVRARPSFEDVMHRTTTSATKRQSTATSITPHARASDALSSQVMQWAQEDETSSSSSDDDGPGLASLLVAAASAQSRRTAASSPALNHHHHQQSRALPSSASKLLPSPVNFDRLGSGAHEHRSPSLGHQDGGARRGIMDRFMSDLRPNSNQVGLLEKEQVAPSISSTAAAAAGPAIPDSPPPRRATYAQHHLLASPVASKPSPSVLFSPDVAKLLRSELDQLEAKEAAAGGSFSKRPSSPLKNVDRSSDIVVDSSPYQPNSPFSQGGPPSRSRDVFGGHGDLEQPPSKRARWTHVVSVSDHGLVSPTSSSASQPLRAPSFCDSSPASSEHGERSQQHGGGSQSQHPASAPDFAAYGTAPASSSPTSSQHSEYVPARYSRSSPGPPSVSGSHASTLSRSNSIASVSGGAPPPAVVAALASASGPTRGGAGGAPPPLSRRTPVPARRDDSFDPTVGQQDPDKKPTWSYAALIGQAIFSAEDRKMSLADIYAFIMRSYPYYKKQDAGWQNSIRHNLSLNECFVKTARGVNNPGKGSLWAVVAGCEDQFADGGFVKRGGAGGSRKRGKAAQAQAQQLPPGAAASAQATVAGTTKGARAQNGVSTRRTKATSPAVSINSARSDSGYSGYVGRGQQQQQQHQPLMISTHAGHAVPASVREYSPSAASISVQSDDASLSPPAPPVMPLSASVLEFNIPAPPLLPRSASAMSVRPQPVYRPEPRFTLSTGQLSSSRPSLGATPCVRSYSTADLTFAAPPGAGDDDDDDDEDEGEGVRPARPHFEHPLMMRTASAPVLSTTTPLAAASIADSDDKVSLNDKAGRESSSPSISRAALAQLREPLVSATMSPPTSVYHRLAGPYQPMYGASSLQNRRALALLASPEAAGIMPAAHPFDRLSGGSPRAPSAPAMTGGGVSFLPSPQIFSGSGGTGGSASKRIRTESDKEDRGYAGLLSPSTLVHTQSPISSVRGGPRVPMSPTQPSAVAGEDDDDKGALLELEQPTPDPEKKPRAIGTRLLPAVNALVDASLHDPFRSPPRTVRTRSPSARGGFAMIQSSSSTAGAGTGSAAVLHTPGKRPLGFSPSLSGGMWSSWHHDTSYNSALDADLEHFNNARQDALGNARSPWPSPAARLSNW